MKSQLPLPFLIFPTQGHDCPVRSMEWSHNGTWMVTSDDRGFVKYWQSNMNNVHTFQAHSEPVRSCRWDRVRSTCTFVCTSTGSHNVLMLPFNLPSTCSCWTDPLSHQFLSLDWTQAHTKAHTFTTTSHTPSPSGVSMAWPSRALTFIMPTQPTPCLGV